MRNSVNVAAAEKTVQQPVKINRAEVKGHSIVYFCQNADGSEEVIKTENPETVIQELDGGVYDDDLPSGMRLVAALWTGDGEKHFVLSAEQNLIIWRWVVAAVFIDEMEDLHGLVEVPDEHGEPVLAAVYYGEHGGIVVYPVSERFALANNIESLAYEVYPADQAPVMATMIYRTMVEKDPERKGLSMSEQGRNGMALLHDGFIETLKTEGIPAAPVAH
jgi:hypothetical protein